MTSDAETIANLRQDIAERDAEVRWLRNELRRVDERLRRLLSLEHLHGKELQLKFLKPKDDA